MSLEKDRAFFRNFSIVVVILALLMVVFFIAASIAGGYVQYGDRDTREQRIADRTAPVGEVQSGDETEADSDQAASDTAEDKGGETQVAAADSDEATNNGGEGKAVYESTCVSCHGTDIPNIPQLGDAEAWAPRIEQGADTLYKHAIEGFQGDSGMPMPAKGGNPDLSDDKVKAAVDYMVENSQ